MGKATRNPKPESPKAAGRSRQRQPDTEALLERIAESARICLEVERRLGALRAPKLENIIKLHRRLVMRFSLEAQDAPRKLKLVKDLMAPLLDWARLEEQKKRRQLAERKYRDEQRTQSRESPGGGALQPKTLEQIEHELNLF